MVFLNRLNKALTWTDKIILEKTKRITAGSDEKNERSYHLNLILTQYEMYRGQQPILQNICGMREKRCSLEKVQKYGG